MGTGDILVGLKIGMLLCELFPLAYSLKFWFMPEEVIIEPPMPPSI